MESVVLLESENLFRYIFHTDTSFGNVRISIQRKCRNPNRLRFYNIAKTLLHMRIEHDMEFVYLLRMTNISPPCFTINSSLQVGLPGSLWVVMSLLSLILTKFK